MDQRKNRRGRKGAAHLKSGLCGSNASNASSGAPQTTNFGLNRTSKRSEADRRSFNRRYLHVTIPWASLGIFQSRATCEAGLTRTVSPTFIVASISGELV